MNENSFSNFDEKNIHKIAPLKNVFSENRRYLFTILCTILYSKAHQILIEFREMQ